MYLQEKKIRLIKIKNNLFTVFGALCIFVCGYYLVSMFVYYRDTPDTALHAVSTTDSIVWTIIGAIMLIQAAVSRSMIGSAAFYSSYFEGDLDGYVSCDDLAEVTGKSPEKVRRELQRYLRRYMKGFEFKKVGDGETVELYSKKILCQCMHCGAEIEKRIFFTGACPYCDSSDLHAKVLANDRFYSISNELDSGVKNPGYYTARNLGVKQTICIIFTALGLSAALIGLMIMISEIPHYFNKEYQKQILLSPDNNMSSYELIKADILNFVIFAAALPIVFLPLSAYLIGKIRSAAAAGIFAKFFAMCRIPFIKASSLPDGGSVSNDKQKLKKVRRAIRRGYLLHCTLEVHGGKLMAALAKKIVKDKCPACGAPINGAVDENYNCKYCGTLIMGVIEKR